MSSKDPDSLNLNSLNAFVLAMAAKDEWILFLEKNPQFNELSKSSFYISVLKFLTAGAFPIDKIHANFPLVENKDLDLIVESLKKLKLISRVSFRGQVVYALTLLGKKLLNIYDRTRSGFKIE